MSYASVSPRSDSNISLWNIKVSLASSLVLALQLSVAAVQAETATAPTPDAHSSATSEPTATDSGSQEAASEQAVPAPAPAVEPSRSGSQAPREVAPATNVASADKEMSDGEPKIESSAPIKFLATSAFAVRLEFGAGAPFGKVIDHEESATSVQGTFDDGTVQQGEISHRGLHFGANVEVAPLRKRNVKLAFRAGYLFTSFIQQSKVGGGKYETKTESAQLLSTHALLIGPVLYFGDRWFGSVQLTAGPISGHVHPYPLADKAGLVSSTDLGFGGWTLRTGPGLGYAFERWVLGFDLLYSYSSIAFHDGVTFDGSSSSSLHALGLNLHAGMHF